MKDIRAPKLKPLVINDPDDASLKWTGEKVLSDGKPKRSPPAKRSPERSTRKKRGRKTKQKSFTVPNEDGLKRMAKKIGISESAVMSLGLAMVIREFDH